MAPTARKECWKLLAPALFLALSPAAMGAQKAAADPAKMKWWDVCFEHGRHLRARTHDQPRAKAIEKIATTEHGFTRADIAGALNREPRIGMTMCAVFAALGRPERTNRSVRARGESYQLVYERRGKRMYVYLDNGVVTSWQD